MVFKLVIVAALIAAASAQSATYRICAHNVLPDTCQALERGNSRVSCLTRSNKLDCAFELARNNAQIGIFSEEEMMLLSQTQPNAHRVIASIRNVENIEPFAFESVAVVPATNTRGIEELRQGGYCHPGLDSTEQRWSPRVLKTLESEVANTNRCPVRDTEGKTHEELEVAALSSFFRAACRPGRWSVDDAIDARLKRDFPNLCTLCSGNGTSDCTGGYRYNMGIDVAAAPNTNRHIQALECLTRYNGSVAYVAWRHVRDYFLQRQTTLIPNYSLLCPNNTLVPLTSEILSTNVSPCAWVRQPWSAVVASSDQAQAILNDMKTWWPTGLSSTSTENWQTLLFETFIGGVNRVLVYEDTTPNAVTYVSSTGRNLTNIDGTGFCMPVQRWCTVSEMEQLKCNWVRTALYTLGIEPAISCQQRQSHLHCLEDIRENKADFIVIDSNYGYLGRQTYNLSPVMLLENQRSYLSRIAALVRSNNTDITRFENLRGKKACFPEFGGIAFVSFVVNGHNKSILSTSECNYAKAVGEFFSGSCAPGAVDKMHQLYDNSFNVSSLCEVCKSQYPTLGNWNDMTCAADYSNLYYGNNGTLACLADNAADVAFVEIQNLNEHLTRMNLQGNTFRALCSSNNSLGWPGVPIPDECLMSLVIDSEVMARRNDPQLASLTSLMTHLDKNFGYTVPTASMLIDLKIYSPFNGTSDLLFKDSVIGLTSPSNSTFEPAKNYFELFRHLERCTGGANGLASKGGVFSILSMVLLSVLSKWVL